MMILRKKWILDNILLIPYLVDQGFVIYSAEVKHFRTFTTGFSKIKKLNLTLARKSGDPFTWEEVKYDFIPLIEITSQKYKLSYRLLFIGYKKIGDKTAYNQFINYADIISDKIVDDVTIHRIEITIEV